MLQYVALNRRGKAVSVNVKITHNVRPTNQQQRKHIADQTYSAGTRSDEKTTTDRLQMLSWRIVTQFEGKYTPCPYFTPPPPASVDADSLIFLGNSQSV